MREKNAFKFFECLQSRGGLEKEGSHELSKISSSTLVYLTFSFYTLRSHYSKQTLEPVDLAQLKTVLESEPQSEIDSMYAQIIEGIREEIGNFEAASNREDKVDTLLQCYGSFAGDSTLCSMATEMEDDTIKTGRTERDEASAQRGRMMKANMKDLGLGSSGHDASPRVSYRGSYFRPCLSKISCLVAHTFSRYLLSLYFRCPLVPAPASRPASAAAPAAPASPCPPASPGWRAP